MQTQVANCNNTVTKGNTYLITYTKVQSIFFRKWVFFAGVGFLKQTLRVKFLWNLSSFTKFEKISFAKF